MEIGIKFSTPGNGNKNCFWEWEGTEIKNPFPHTSIFNVVHSLGRVMCIVALYRYTGVISIFTVSPYSSTRGHDYKLFIQYSRVDARKYFWSNRVVHAWNLLPAKPSDLASLV